VAPYDYWFSEPAPKALSELLQRDRTREHYGAVFDWSVFPPTIAAPIWLFLNLWDPADVGMALYAAEIYRADLAPGMPTELPGPAWLCLDVLDAIQTGAHGMPVLVREGRLDPNALGEFVRANPSWASVLSFGKRNGGALAIINDLGTRAAGTVHEEPAAPQAPGNTTPAGDDDVSSFTRYLQGDRSAPQADAQPPAPDPSPLAPVQSPGAMWRDPYANLPPLPLPFPVDNVAGDDLDAMLASLTTEELQQILAEVEAGA